MLDMINDVLKTETGQPEFLVNKCAIRFAQDRMSKLNSYQSFNYSKIPKFTKTP